MNLRSGIFMNKKLFILGVLIALCGVLCCGFVTAVELDNGTCVEPLSLDEEVSGEPLSVDESVSVESVSADENASEPLGVVDVVSAEPLCVDNGASVEILSVDSGDSSSILRTSDVQYKTVTYKEKVFSHYKKYTKKFKCILYGGSVKKVKKEFKQRMTYGDDECCKYSVTKVVRAWYNDYKAYSWKIKKVKKMSKKKYSAQYGGKIAKYRLVVKLFYKKPVYKTVTYTEKVRVY